MGGLNFPINENKGTIHLHGYRAADAPLFSHIKSSFSHYAAQFKSFYNELYKLALFFYIKLFASALNINWIYKLNGIFVLYSFCCCFFFITETPPNKSYPRFALNLYSKKWGNDKKC